MRIKRIDCDRSRGRWIAAGIVIICSGCAMPWSSGSAGFSLKEAKLERDVAKQVQHDPFPTSKEAGIRKQGDAESK
ncbi:MAG: hypothetical protein KDA42_06005 [Planctomycetales bacterium]|nr:hypothetical protein [Planctomycetales bacterium]